MLLRWQVHGMSGHAEDRGSRQLDKGQRKGLTRGMSKI